MDQESNIELHKYNLTMRVDIYKTHFDLFVKGVALYLAIVGAIAGLIFQPSATGTTRSALALFVGLCSGLGVAGSRIGIAWTRAAQADMDQISDALGITRLSLIPASRIATLALTLSSCLLALSIFAAGWFILGQHPK